MKNVLKFFGSILRGMKDAKFRSLLFFVLIILLIGTFFYHKVEGWRWLDSFYFSSMSLTTVGYGDLSPKTDAGKIFTVFYIFSGVGVILSFISSVANKAHEKSATEELIDKKRKSILNNL
ncbi:MAG: potassium channel family protein [Candidatus Falkowbacteria bacterium]